MLSIMSQPVEAIKEKNPFAEQKVLWPLTTGYTILYLGLMIADFALRDKFNMPLGMMVVYIALVTAYAGEKEIRRWTGKSLPGKWGSLFVYAWFIFFAVAFTLKTFVSSFELPEDLTKVCLQVLGIFFGSKLSGKIYSMKQEAKDFESEFMGRSQKVLALIAQQGEIATQDVSKFLGVSKATARRVLDNLEQEGKITQQGEGRGVHYVLKN